MLPPRQSILILLVEDSYSDAEILTASLSGEHGFEGENYEIERVPSLSSGLQALARSKFDVLLLDLSLPDSCGISSLIKVREIHPDLPIVVLTGLDDQKLSVLSVKHGAQDYLVKGQQRTDSIRKAIRYAIERKNFETGMKRLAVLEQRETFIAMLAHDLRNPLIGCERVLKTFIEGKVGHVPPAQIELISVMYRSMRALLQMITNVLDCYRLESGCEQIRSENFNLSALLAECLRENRHVAQSKRIRLSRSSAPGIMAHGDPLAMRRVVNNLLSNALKFTPADGEIQTSIRRDGDKVMMEITDNGVGILPEKLDRLFELFFQSNPDNRAQGLGIGLHICKNLMEAQKGTITCASKPDCGTTFQISLPIRNSQEAATPRQKPEPPAVLEQAEALGSPVLTFGPCTVEDTAGLPV